MEDGKFLASTDVLVENEELGHHADVDIVVQERFPEASDQHVAEAPKTASAVQARHPSSGKTGVGFQLGGEWELKAWTRRRRLGGETTPLHA